MFQPCVRMVRNQDEPIYNLMASKLGHRITFSDDLGTLPDLRAFREKHQEVDKVVVIIDDFMTEISKNKTLQNWCIACRKCGIVLILITQNFYSISKSIRNQCSHFVLFRLESASDRRLIRDELCLGRDDIFNFYQAATSGMNVFCVDQTTRSLKTKFRKNFLGFKEFPPTEKTS